MAIKEFIVGPLVAFGSGGVLVEILDDIVFRVLPLTDRDVSEMINGSRVAIGQGNAENNVIENFNQNTSGTKSDERTESYKGQTPLWPIWLSRLRYRGLPDR